MLPGPLVTFFGIANSDGCFACNVPSCLCSGTPSPTPQYDAQGRRIFQAAGGRFLLVVEAKPGSSGAKVGSTLTVDPAVDRPDLQIENEQQMGEGSTAVCDIGPGAGGIPGINPPDFGPSQFVSDALADFACRFESHLAASPCTLNASGLDSTLGPVAPTVQFCDQVSTTAAFPEGDSLLSVQVADIRGNIGPTAQIIVRVVTPTPPPTPTPETPTP